MRPDDDWLLTAARLAIHRPTATGVLADLHLGYGEARRRRGEAVPVVPLADVLAPLRAPLAAHGVRELVIAGDLFEAGPSRELAEELLRWLEGVGVTLTAVVPGNHDRGLKAGGRTPLPVQAEGATVGGWRVVHGDGPLPPGPVVQGHEHPCVRWSGRLTAPCYLLGDNHLVLPAFSADAAGVNVRREPRWANHRCAVIVGDDVLDFGPIGEFGLRNAD